MTGVSEVRAGLSERFKTAPFSVLRGSRPMVIWRASSNERWGVLTGVLEVPSLFQRAFSSADKFESVVKVRFQISEGVPYYYVSPHGPHWNCFQGILYT